MGAWADVWAELPATGERQHSILSSVFLWVAVDAVGLSTAIEREKKSGIVLFIYLFSASIF